MVNEATVPMRKTRKEEDDSTESKGGHGVNTRAWRPHTTRVELIETNTRILLFREASTNEDSRPLPRKARPRDFQKWVKKLNKKGDPFKHMANLEVELVHDWHIQFGGFGMTLDGEALTWFQNLEKG